VGKGTRVCAGGERSSRSYQRENQKYCSVKSVCYQEDYSNNELSCSNRRIKALKSKDWRETPTELKRLSAVWYRPESQTNQKHDGRVVTKPR
jgi:hypothetical protein